MKGNIPGYRKKEYMWGYLFVALPVLGFLIFGLGAMIASLVLSLTNWNLLTAPKFIGLQNFVQLLHDPKFYQSLYNTIYLMIGVPVGMLISLFLAAVMNEKMKGITILRTLYYIPVISPIIAISMIWQWLFNSDYGIVNEILHFLFHIHGPNWFTDPVWVKPNLIMLGIWTGLGSTMLLYLAGLQTIPRSYYEAAEVDGATGWRKMIHITFPLLSPVHFFLMVTGVIGAFQTFSQIYVLAPDGGPQFSAATVVYYIYQNAFKYYQMGYASAIAWILMLFILLLTLIQFKVRKRWVFEE